LRLWLTAVEFRNSGIAIILNLENIQVKLSVIGCGHLGAVHAACMAEIGHEVLGVDIDEGKIALLNSGKAGFHEPGLDEMLARNVAARRLRFTTSFAEAAEFGHAHFLGVATPGRPDGSYDLSQVSQAVTSLARHVHKPCLVVGKSTVPPGTAAALKEVAANVSPAGHVEIAWNPEFLREGCAVRDTLMPDRIVIGVASDSAEIALREVYGPITAGGTALVVTDLATAELVKGAANAFLAMRISFINAMADICTVVNGDVRALAHALGLDPRIGPSFLKAGIGYGGSCLPKDVRGLAEFAGQAGTHHANELLALVDTINTSRRDRVVGMAEEAVRTEPAAGHSHAGCALSGKRIAVWGAAYKPGTDDVRDSPGLEIARRLHHLGADVTVYDPMATGNALTLSPELAYADSALAAVSHADAVVVVTAWPEFAEISPAAAALAAGSMTIVDACQGIDVATWQEAGWRVLSLTGDHAGP
jgi:UDPglucose 6-dehydrogenase